jgi:D-alanine-D-alanine ligase
MRIGIISEAKLDHPLRETGPRDIDSGLLSQEEEDELLSGLRDAGYDVELIDGLPALLTGIDEIRGRCDLVFNKSCGYRGVDDKLVVPAVLDAAGIPYLGSAPYVQGLVRNKHHTKLVAAAAGVRTPPAAVVAEGRTPSLAHVTFPAIVKPLGESSSLGVEAGKAIVDGPGAAIERARELIRLYHQPAIVETFVRGMEVEVPILADPDVRALGVVALTVDGQVVSGDVYLSSEVVYYDGYGFAPPPASLDGERVAEAAVQAAVALDVRDYARVDFRVAEDGTPWLMEANTSPHVQRHSSFFALAKQRGLAYHEMLDEIVSIATRRIRASSPSSGSARRS